MRRPFLTFAGGMLGVGLPFLCLGTGIALMIDGVKTPQVGLPVETGILYALAAVAGMLLLAGLWTPVRGSPGLRA